jgi:hypothetical protein
VLAASISLMPGTICLTKTDRLTNDPVGIAPVGSFIYEPADVDVGRAHRGTGLRALKADVDRPVQQSSNQPPPHVARYVAFSSSLIPVTGTPIRA